MLGSTWPALCACAVLLAALSQAAPTPDTLVVAPFDDAAETTTAADTTVDTTEGPMLPLKLKSMEVKSEVTLRYAHTTVMTRMRNPATRAQEATFSILLPETAFISGFTMILDGKSYKAYVKEKEEAKKIYTDAVSQGFGTALVAAKARDSNHFTVSVNVEPTTEAVFNLTYEELLDRRNGVYNHAVNLHPGVVVPELKVSVHIKEGKKITILRVPELRTGNEIDPTAADAQNPSAKIERSSDEREATITFTPTLEEQRELMDVYAHKTRESRARSERRSYYSEPEKTADGVLGQFVVQYDVERSTDGEVLVNDGYFVHFFAPTNLPPLSKHVVFVLDTSGSMMDRKIEQLREAMTSILGELKSGDFFNIVEFNSATKVYDLSKEISTQQSDRRHMYYSYMHEQQDVSIFPPAQATPENIRLAKLIVNGLSAGGGTNIAQALTTAIKLINKGVGWVKEEKSNDTTESTTVAVTAAPVEEEVSLTPVDTAETDVPRPEPVIIFLTDGDPTVGESDPKRIISKVSELNYGEKKASIFSLAFGEDADRGFLRKLSLGNEGFMRHIYEAADAALQLRNFYAQVSSPLLSNVRFIYPKEQVLEDSITKHRVRTFYDGSEVIVAGKMLAQPETLNPEIIGICGVKDDDDKHIFKRVLRIPTKRESEAYLPLERLWAYLTIRQLLDARDAKDEDKSADDEKSPGKRALKLALQYSFVTPLTSLVVVKPNATSAVDAESVDKPNSLSASGYSSYASYSGFGGGSVDLQPSVSHNMFVRPMAASYSSPFRAFAAPAYLSSNSMPQVQYDSLAAVEDADGDYEGSADSPGQSGYSYISTTPVAYYPLALEPEVLTNAAAESPSTSPQVTSLAPQVPTEAPSTPDPLVAYHLQDFQWLRAYLNATTDTLDLPVNGTIVNLKLLKDPSATFDSPAPECANALDGNVGTCEYLTHCEAAKTISLQTYETVYCSRNEFAGVCCPKNT